jgi:hypothetical protein
MKKALLALAALTLVLAVAGSVLGCNNGTTKSTKPSNKPSSSPSNSPGPDGGPTVFELGDFDIVNSSSKKGWGINGADGVTSDLTSDIVLSAQYLVIENTNPSNTYGFGGFQFITQGDGDDWDGWFETNINDLSSGWTNFNTEGKVYYVIDLSKLDLSIIDESDESKIYIGGVNVLPSVKGYLLIDWAALTKGSEDEDLINMTGNKGVSGTVYGFVTKTSPMD